MLVAASCGACTQTLDFDSLSSGHAAIRPVHDAGSISPEHTFTCMDEQDATFCDDFDTRAPDKTWTMVIVEPGNAGGYVKAEDNDDALSAPKSLLVSVPGKFDKGVSYAASALQRTFASYTGMHIRVNVAFDMRVEKFDSLAYARIIAFQFLYGDATSYNQLVYALESREDSIVSQFSESVGPAPKSRAGDFENLPDLDEWVHVEFELNVANPEGGGNRVTLTVDDVKLFDNELELYLRGGEPRMELGIPWVDSSKATEPWRIRYDNVLVNIEQKQ
jgi:hypothetical protein